LPEMRGRGPVARAAFRENVPVRQRRSRSVGVEVYCAADFRDRSRRPCTACDVVDVTDAGTFVGGELNDGPMRAVLGSERRSAQLIGAGRTQVIRRVSGKAPGAGGCIVDLVVVVIAAVIP